MHLTPLFATLVLLILSCSPRADRLARPTPSSNSQSDTIYLSPVAEAYIAEVVAVMQKDAIYRSRLDFSEIQQTIRHHAHGAQTVEDTHGAVAEALRLLDDHHSGFFPVSMLKNDWGWSDEDITSVKAGIPPDVGDDELATLAEGMDFAQGRLLEGSVAYVSVPSFESMYRQGMLLFTDSLQLLIKGLDAQKPLGWVIDLRNNDGGNAMPMIAGLGPLLDAKNSFYGIDETGKVRTQSFYHDGYYDVEDQGQPTLLLAPNVKYRVLDTLAPVIVLTSSKTASSAEAVVAIFKGQPNVTVVGARTNGLTTVNSFEFLSDNSVLNLTMAHYANRDSELYVEGIDPDMFIPSAERDRTDIVLDKAVELVLSGE